MFISSSFQTHSIPLLNVISTSGVPVDVVFINTGFHFPETLTFKNQVEKIARYFGCGYSVIHPQAPAARW